MLRATTLVLATLTTALHTSPGHSQTTTVPKPDGEWRGALGIGYTSTSGNTDSVTYSINGDAVRQTTYDKFGAYVQAVNGRREEEDGETIRTANQARAGLAYTRDIRSSNDRFFGFGQADWDRNLLIDLRLRSVFAGGVGYHVVKGEHHTFDISTGPAYNRERFTADTRDQIEWLVAEESSHTLTPTTTFKQKLSTYSNLKEGQGGEYRVVFDAALVFKVNSRWNLTMTFNSRHQSNPPVGVEKTDTLFVTGIQYMFNP